MLYDIAAFVTDGQKMKYHREAKADFKPTVWAVFYKSAVLIFLTVHMTWNEYKGVVCEYGSMEKFYPGKMAAEY